MSNYRMSKGTTEHFTSLEEIFSREDFSDNNYLYLLNFKRLKDLIEITSVILYSTAKVYTSA